MKRNFAIKQSIEVCVNEIFFDLHNFSILSEVKFSFNLSSFSISFSEIDQSSYKFMRKITFNFREVTYLHFSSRFFPIYGKNLEEIGFKSPDDINLDWLVSDDNSNPCDHMIFRVENDEYLRIYSNDASACVSPVDK